VKVIWEKRRKERASPSSICLEGFVTRNKKSSSVQTQIQLLRMRMSEWLFRIQFQCHTLWLKEWSKLLTNPPLFSFSPPPRSNLSECRLSRALPPPPPRIPETGDPGMGFRCVEVRVSPGDVPASLQEVKDVSKNLLTLWLSQRFASSTVLRGIYGHETLMACFYFVVWLVLGSAGEWGGGGFASRWAGWVVHSQRQQWSQIHFLSHVQTQWTHSTRPYWARSCKLITYKPCYLIPWLIIINDHAILCLLLRWWLMIWCAQGNFSFGPLTRFKASTIVDFVEKAVAHSRSGRYLFFLHRRPVLGPMRVQLLHPYSRFRHPRSLQHMCR